MVQVAATPLPFQINNGTFLEAFTMPARHSTAPSDAGKPQKP